MLEAIQPAYSWTGFYIGGYAGGSLGVARGFDVPFPNFTGGNRFSPNGFTGGALAGYNVQIGSFVLGGEGDIGYDARRSAQDYENHVGALRHEKFSGSYLGRLRGRLGFATNDLLLFAAGGVSFADGKLTFSNPFNGAFTESASRNYTGYNVGGGVEYLFAQNWVGRLEYIYDDLGQKTFTFSGAPDGYDTRKIDLREHTVRVAVEYKF